MLKKSDILVLNLVPGFSDDLSKINLRITTHGYFEYADTKFNNGNISKCELSGHFNDSEFKIIENVVMSFMEMRQSEHEIIDDIGIMRIEFRSYFNETIHELWRYCIDIHENSTLEDQFMIEWNKVIELINARIKSAQQGVAPEPIIHQ